jgi:hypothetical protein
MLEALAFVVTLLFLARCWFQAVLPQGWRRSLPDLIYNIRIDLGGHQKLDLSAATNTRPLLIGKLVLSYRTVPSPPAAGSKA